jgi:hypothetical protein
MIEGNKIFLDERKDILVLGMVARVHTITPPCGSAREKNKNG